MDWIYVYRLLKLSIVPLNDVVMHTDVATAWSYDGFVSILLMLFVLILVNIRIFMITVIY